MPLIQSGQVILAEERRIRIKSMHVERSPEPENQWYAHLVYEISNETGVWLSNRFINYQGDRFRQFKNQVFQPDALRKLYTDFINNTEFDTDVPTGVENDLS